VSNHYSRISRSAIHRQQLAWTVAEKEIIDTLSALIKSIDRNML